MKNVQTNLRLQVKFPLGVKLAIIIGTIVLVSLGCVTFLNSHFIAQDVQITAENNNLTINSRSAGTVEDKLSTIRSNVFQLLDLLNVVGGKRESVPLRLARQPSAVVVKGKETNIKQEIFIKSFEYAPVSDGEIVGRIDFYSGDNLIDSVELLADGAVDVKEYEVKQEQPKSKLRRFFEKIRDKIRNWM